MPRTKTNKKGFTLIELLIVIAIVAIIAIAVVLVLNPAELLKQSRDSTRMSDVSTLKTAIALYLTDVSNPNLASSTPGYTGCYMSTLPGVGTTTAKCGVFVGGGITTNVSSSAVTFRKIDSSGWIPINFTQISIGTPFGSLPVDPTNNLVYYYAYAASSTNVFELDAILESAKYLANASSDGGDNAQAFETGTNLKL